MRRRFSVPQDQTGKTRRVDRMLADLLEPESVSRSKIRALIEQGLVSINGQVVKRAGGLVETGDVIECVLPTAQNSSLEADGLVRFAILFEDEEILVLDKPADLVVHPGAGVRESTLVQGLLAHCGETLRSVGHVLRPGIVHRLDRGTSGLMVVAKTERSYAALTKQFLPPRQISRTYQAVTHFLPRGSGKLEGAIARSAKDRRKMAVTKKGGRSAVTRWREVEALRYGYLLELVLETGRTHQIRVHLKHSGAPVIGDPIYGLSPGGVPPRFRAVVGAFPRQALHAARLSLLHPQTGERMEFLCELPEDMKSLLVVLRS